MKTYNDAKKLEARLETIVNPYRKHFGKSLPLDKQYYTLCAKHATHRGNIIKNTELDQMLSLKLIVPNQFHGIDKDKKVIQLNSQIKESHWHCGDFLSVIQQQFDNVSFNPGVVNFDSMGTSKTLVEYFGRLLYLLSGFSDILVVGNFVLEYRSLSYSFDDLLNDLKQSIHFRNAYINGWKMDKGYAYYGTGHSGTKMGSVVLTK